MKVVLMTTVPVSLRFLRGHIRMLQSHGADVHVISSPGAQLEKFAAEYEVTAHGIEMPRRISPLQDSVAMWRLVRCMRNIRPDIVHAHTPKAGLLGMLAARAAGVPRRLYHIHGLPMETARGIKRQILRWCERVATGLAQNVFCVSNSLKERVESEQICGSQKMSVLAGGAIDGIDAAGQFNPMRFSVQDSAQLCESLGIPAEAPVIGFVGRIVADKGIRELLVAFKQLQSEFSDLHLVIAGTLERHQPLPHELELAITNNPRVHITGFVDDPAPYYAIMDVLALPTHREGFGLVAAEAAAMEIPVVATQVTGCVDAVRDGVTGTLVPPRDASRLATAIANYLRNPDFRRVHGLSGRIRMLQEFQPEAVRSALWQHYRKRQDIRRAANKNSLPSPRLSYANYYKRCADASLSAAALTLLLPLMALVALLVRWRLGAPVIFWQKRPGFGGKLFWMPKFRTMTSATDKAGKLLPDNKRLTRFGQFLRATSLDELPELWCVLRGEMSLVGPRPLLTEYLERYTPEQARRHDVKPGITGLAQVNGRNAISWNDKFNWDLRYIDSVSFWLDMKILCLTVVRVLRRDGVHAASHVTMPIFYGAAGEQSAASASGQGQ